jgi:hypothetical protein
MYRHAFSHYNQAPLQRHSGFSDTGHTCLYDKNEGDDSSLEYSDRRVKHPNLKKTKVSSIVMHFCSKVNLFHRLIQLKMVVSLYKCVIKTFSSTPAFTQAFYDSSLACSKPARELHE